METPNKTPKAKRDTRRVLLEASLDVIALEGVQAVTHRRVAKQAGVSHGVASYHFSTIEELLNESFRHHLQGLTNLSDDITQAGFTNDPQVFIGQMVEFVRRDQANEGSIAADFELMLFASRDSKLQAMYLEWEFKILTEFALALGYLGASSPERAARILIRQIRGFELDGLIHTDSKLQQFEQDLQLLMPQLLA